MRRTRFVPLSILALTLSGGAVAYAQPTAPLLKPTRREGLVRLRRDPVVLRQRLVVVDPTALKGEQGRKLLLPLFGPLEIILVRDRQEIPRKNTLLWYGRVAGQPGSTAVLSMVGDALSGVIMTVERRRPRFYEIRYLGRGVHGLLQVEQSRYPQESDPIGRQSEEEETARDEPTCSSDPATDIDALVLYTPAAKLAAGGTDGIETTIYLAVALTNLSYVNSGIAQRLRLSHMAEVSYVEDGTDMDIDLNRLKTPTDGPMDNVLGLRNTYAADVVALLVEYPPEYDSCGISFIMYNVSNDQERRAYAVVARKCAGTAAFSFTHELGHIMSARHDWHVDDALYQPYAYNHGYVFKSTTGPPSGWRTIMAWSTDCIDSGIAREDCPRLLYWSNPEITYPPGDPAGVPMGVASGNRQSDNQKTLDKTALTVANFRCSSIGVGNVWMKDTWSDTGREPDPQTVGQDMWKSPYIWVRRTRDESLTEQHRHEDPAAGSTNWVYAKLHNGGNDTSGDLQLFWANASTSILWPAGWTPLATVPVSSFAKNTVRILETPWTPPGAGHYCLLARWVSTADPMTSAETADIGQNARNSNNIVWRNLNIVDLGENASAEADFDLGSPTAGEEVTQLVIRSSGADSFLRYGRVAIELDDVLLRAWREGGTKGSGLRAEGRRFVVGPEGAVLDNLRLPRGVPGRVRVAFGRLPETPRQTFFVDFVQQLEGAPGRGEAPRILGGVSYEVRIAKVRNRVP